MIKSIETVNAYMIIIPKTDVLNRKRAVTVKFSLKILNSQLFYIERELLQSYLIREYRLSLNQLCKHTNLRDKIT